MYKTNAPQILIAHDNSLPPDILAEIQFGIEEEGLFSKYVEFASSNIRNAAYSFACNASTGVCAAANKNYALLAHEKCSPEYPVLYYAMTCISPDFFRILGKNAARLVKGRPFI